MNIRLIFEAWIIANNPTEKQIQLAEARAKVCNDCPAMKTSILAPNGVCSECSCPIRKKIFTNEFNTCPLQKWRETDFDYFEGMKKKTTLL